MKKVIFAIIISMGLLAIGCEKTTQTNDNSNSNNYNDSSESSDTKQFSKLDKNKDSKDSNEEQQKEKEKIDISSMDSIISEVLYYMYQNGQTYDTVVSKENINEVAYGILNYYIGDEHFVMSNDGSYFVKIARDDANQYIKAASSSFDGSLLRDTDNLYSIDDMYYIMPSDGAPWIATDVLDAYNNNDGTYIAIVNAYFESNGGDHEYVGQYKICLVDNDSSSEFEYRISDIESI